MSKNSKNGRIAQEKGRKAELRVIEFCKNLSLETNTSKKLDYGEQVDVVVVGRGFQVSCYPKSSQARKSLQKKDIYNISAGEQVSDERLQEQIIEGLDNSDSFPMS